MARAIYHGGADRLIMRGDPGGSRWAACWLAGDRLPSGGHGLTGMAERAAAAS
jgi:hypothetical protein